MELTDRSAQVEQHVSPGGVHVAEMSRAAAAVGRDKGYIARRLSATAVFGCTCGEFVEGPAEAVATALHRHVTSNVFREGPADGA